MSFEDYHSVDVAREAYEQSLFADMAEQLMVQASQLSATRQLEKQVGELETTAQVDELTGLFRRGFFESEIEAQYVQAKRLIDLERQHSVLVLDLDNFKSVNDTLGHTKGDECLQEAAKIIDSSLLRDGDLACRWGGEEFAVFLPDTTLEDAYRVAARIRGEINNYTPDESIGQIGVSIGIATYLPRTSFKEAFDLADKAMLDSKKQSPNTKNQIVVVDN